MKKTVLLILCCIGISSFKSDKRVNDFIPPFFVIVAPTYNNAGSDEITGEPLCIGHIKSVVKQEYPYWHMIIIDDCSTDSTVQLLEQFVEEYNLQDKVTIHKNKIRKKALYNIWKAVHSSPDAAIIVCLDGDDELYDHNVLSRIAHEYNNNQTWLTYGQFIWYPSNIIGVCEDIPKEVYQQDALRDYQWVTSHLRTFKAWLFKNIDTDDLMINGEFFPMAWDVAIMLPMLEMAGFEHVRFIPDVLYTYKATPCNDHVTNRALQIELDEYIRSQDSYEPLH